MRFGGVGQWRGEFGCIGKSLFREELILKVRAALQALGFLLQWYPARVGWAKLMAARWALGFGKIVRREVSDVDLLVYLVLRRNHHDEME
jgi:hypothetical protein